MKISYRVFNILLNATVAPALMYLFYLFGLLEPRPGFEWIFNKFFAFLGLAFLATVIASLLAIIYNSLVEANKGNL